MDNGIDPNLLKPKEDEENVKSDIDVLDFDPMIKTPDQLPKKKEKKEVNTKEKKKNGFKMVIFTIVILLLMGAVGFGVYYYLSLGTAFMKKTDITITLNKIEINIGDKLSQDIKDYASVEGYDIKKCEINLSNVDNENAGEYEYSVTCKNKVKKQVVVVNEFQMKIVNNKILYRSVGDEINAEDFILLNEGESAEFYEKLPSEAGGPYFIKIKVSGNEEYLTYGLLVLFESKPKMYLTCYKDESNYKLTDKIAIDYNKNAQTPLIRTSEYVYSSDEQYAEVISKINNGKLTIGDNTGYVIVSLSDNKVKIVKEFALEESLGIEYSKINNYYRNTLKYKCSI